MSTSWVATFDEEIERLIAETGVSPEKWKTAGRKTKAAPVGEDISWWRGEGLSQIVAYQAWIDSSNLTIATMPDGKPGVEWGITGRLTQDDGAVPIKMFSDLIVEAGAPDRLMIIDHKTGSKDPGTAHQLALYASMIEATQGVRPLIGAYYMTRKASLTSPTSLNEWGINYWDQITRQVKHAVQSSIFIPNTGWQCNLCSMAKHCQAVGGMEAKGYDSLAGAPVAPVEPPEHLSWSQISNYLWCAKQYELQRLRRLPEQPSVWLAAGVAVHRELEAINLKRWEAQQ